MSFNKYAPGDKICIQSKAIDVSGEYEIETVRKANKSFSDFELDSLIIDCRKSVERTPSSRRISSDITPSIMLGVKKLHDDVAIPAYAHSGDCCFDIRAYGEPEYQHASGAAVVKTGLALDIPAGFAMIVYSRSGHGFNYDVRLANGTGIIDSGYKGELMVKLTADSGKGQEYLDTIKHGDRIAQAMLIPVPHVSLVEVGELSGSDRGAAGFGSTGVK